MSSKKERSLPSGRSVFPSHTTIFVFVSLAVLTLGIIVQPRFRSIDDMHTGFQTLRSNFLTSLRTGWSFGSSTSYLHQEEYGPIIGIDLGQTYCRISYSNNGTVEMITDEQNESDIPSNGSIWSLEEDAEDKNPIKPFGDWLSRIYQSLSSSDGQGVNMKVVTKWALQVHTLKRARELASRYLGQPISHAIITIPADANDSERQALRDAASLAGLTPLRIINAPMATAIGYGIDKFGGETTIVVVDVGASASRVSVMELDDGVFEILATIKDNSLGGDAYTEKIVQWMGGKVGILDRSDLVLEAERIKREMSCESSQSSAHGHQLTNEEFKTMTQDLVEGTLTTIQRAIHSADLVLNSIEHVIITGGSGNLPEIQSMVRACFGKEPLAFQPGKPEEAAARGAAIQGALVAAPDELGTPVDLTMLEVGIETSGGLFDSMIAKHSILPAIKSRDFLISKYQTQPVIIRVYEGVRRLAQDNRLLIEIKLPGLDPGSNITVTLHQNANGHNYVKVHNLSGTLTIESDIEPHDDRWSIYLEDEEKFKDLEDPDNTREKIKLRSTELREYVSRSKNMLPVQQEMSPRQREQFQQLDKIFDLFLVAGAELSLDEVDEMLGQARAVMEEGLDRLPVAFKPVEMTRP